MKLPIAAIATAIAVAGCALTPDYRDVVWACDQRRAPAEPSCSNRGDISQTVGFYESPGGTLIFRLRDYGDGINCRILDVGTRWMKIELTTGRVGYVDFNEPISTSTPIH